MAHNNAIFSFVSSLCPTRVISMENRLRLWSILNKLLYYHEHIPKPSILKNGSMWTFAMKGDAFYIKANIRPGKWILMENYDQENLRCDDGHIVDFLVWKIYTFSELCGRNIAALYGITLFNLIIAHCDAFNVESHSQAWVFKPQHKLHWSLKL